MKLTANRFASCRALFDHCAGSPFFGSALKVEVVEVYPAALLVGGENRLHLAPLAEGLVGVAQLEVPEDVVIPGSPIQKGTGACSHSISARSLRNPWW